jgi:hypothetical protein
MHHEGLSYTLPNPWYGGRQWETDGSSVRFAPEREAEAMLCALSNELKVYNLSMPRRKAL